MLWRWNWIFSISAVFHSRCRLQYVPKSFQKFLIFNHFHLKKQLKSPNFHISISWSTWQRAVLLFVVRELSLQLFRRNYFEPNHHYFCWLRRRVFIRIIFNNLHRIERKITYFVITMLNRYSPEDLNILVGTNEMGSGGTFYIVQTITRRLRYVEF